VLFWSVLARVNSRIPDRNGLPLSRNDAVLRRIGMWPGPPESQLLRNRFSEPTLESWVVCMVLGADYQAGTNVNDGEVPLRMKYRQRSSVGRAGAGMAAGMRNE